MKRNTLSHVKHILVGGLLLGVLFAPGSDSVAWADDEEFELRVVAFGLASPTGIAVRGNRTVYFTEVPTPGVAGGMNAVKKTVRSSPSSNRAQLPEKVA